MNVLAIGPHPDDIELYAGGTVAALVGAGAHVVLLDLTRGERGTRGNAEIRAAEAAVAARILGVKGRECLGLPDTLLNAQDPGQLRTLVEALRRHRPDLILAPHEDDPHPDHQEAARMTRRAHFLARLAGYAASGEAFSPGPIYWYEQKTSFEPHVVVDITPHRERKREAVNAYPSQFSQDPAQGRPTEISQPSFHEALEARMRLRGASIHVAYGEGFQLSGPVPVRDVFSFFGGGQHP